MEQLVNRNKASSQNVEDQNEKLGIKMHKFGGQGMHGDGIWSETKPDDDLVEYQVFRC